MVGEFAVLNQRGPFSRTLLSYDMAACADSVMPGSWYLVPLLHNVSPALLVTTSAAPADVPGIPEPVLGICSAPGIYPPMQDHIGALRLLLEEEVLGWDDALAVVRFLQSSQAHARNRPARLAVGDPAGLLHQLQVVSARDAAFSASTSGARELLSLLAEGDDLNHALWRLDPVSRRNLYAQGVVVDAALADVKDASRTPPCNSWEPPMFLVDSFDGRAASVLPCMRQVLGAGGSVAVVTSADPLTDLYESRLRTEWNLPVVRWPAAPPRTFKGDPLSTIWLSTRQFSSALLPQVRLVVVDLGVPGEWPFFWQRFSQGTLVRLVEAFCQVRGAACQVGASVPTLSVLDATGNLPLISAASAISRDRLASPVFIVRSSSGGSRTEPRTGIVLPETMKLLRHTFELHLPSVLLLNLRGYATLIECTECGYTATCPDCGSTLTLNSDRTQLFCKQCGHTEQAPDICPNCGGSALRARGYGLDKLQRELGRTFPASALQLAGGPAVSQSLIYLGTYADVQTIAGLRPALVVFPDIGVGLRHPVFDNVEQLATVVLGAVVEAAPGSVVVQLDRRSLGLRSHLESLDAFEGFLASERAQRQALAMPPYSRQFVVQVPLPPRRSSDVTALTAELGSALEAEGLEPLGLHADLLHGPGSRATVSLEFRVGRDHPTPGTSVSKALAHSRLFRTALVRVY